MITTKRCHSFIENARRVHSDQDNFVAQTSWWDVAGKNIADRIPGEPIRTLEVEQHLPPAGISPDIRAVVGLERPQSRFAQVKCLWILRVRRRFDSLPFQ